MCTSMRSRRAYVRAALIALLCAGLAGCKTDGGRKAIMLECTNPASIGRADVLITIDYDLIAAQWPDFRPESGVVFDGSLQLPTQAVDRDGDGQADVILCLVNLAAQESKSLRLTQLADGEKRHAHAKRTQAVLAEKSGYTRVKGEYTGGAFVRRAQASIPPGHFAHNAFFKFEGPGWESDRIGYRLYLDSRNRIDIFGKKTKDMVLQDVGNTDLVSNHKESYTKDEAWGMDMFRVGESFGIGSFALWENGAPVFVAEVDSVHCRVVADGDVYSAIELSYVGWKVGDAKRRLTALLSIGAGSRLTRVDLTLEGESPAFCTGLARHQAATVVYDKGESSGRWGYVASFGAQSLIGDTLGIALFYDPQDHVATTMDSLSHIVVLRPRSGVLTYYLAGAWGQEPVGISSLEEYQDDLQHTAIALGSPVQVTVAGLTE